MRLWHKDLISVLPRKQLQGQWRELSSIAGLIDKNGTPNHILVNKVCKYNRNHLSTYGLLVENELTKRGIRTSKKVKDKIIYFPFEQIITLDKLFEGWHNDRYLIQCVYNLQEKYDCGGITQKDWELIENKFYKINKDKSINDVWNEFIDLLGKECLKREVK